MSFAGLYPRAQHQLSTKWHAFKTPKMQQWTRKSRLLQILACHRVRWTPNSSYQVLRLETSVPLHCQLLSPPLLQVLTLHVIQVSSQSLYLVFVLVDLCLVHVQLTGHRFHLLRLLTQVCLRSCKRSKSILMV